MLRAAPAFQAFHETLREYERGPSLKRRARSLHPIEASATRRSLKEVHMKLRAAAPVISVSVIAFATFVGVGAITGGQGYARADESRDGDEGKELSKIDRQINERARRTVDQGRQIFRFDTFGSEAFFGDALQLHPAIAGARNGGFRART